MTPDIRWLSEFGPRAGHGRNDRRPRCIGPPQGPGNPHRGRRGSETQLAQLLAKEGE